MVFHSAEVKCKMARKSLLDRTVDGNFDPKVEVFFQCIKLGMSETAACDKAEINRDTVYDWKKRGNEDKKNGLETDYSAFIDTYKKMRAECQQYLIQNIMKASTKSWQAGAWLLQHRFFEDFGDDNSKNGEDNQIQITLVKKDKK